MTVTRGCGTANEQRSAAASATVAAVSPAFFNVPLNRDGRNPLIALHGGGPTWPARPDLGAAFTPAEPGEFVTLFGTGFGATEPPLATGQIPGAAGQTSPRRGLRLLSAAWPFPRKTCSTRARRPAARVSINSRVRVPADVPDGDATVTAVVQGVSTPEGPYLTVRRPQ